MIPDMVPRGICQIALLLDLWGLAKISHTRARTRQQQALSKDSRIKTVVSKQYHYKTSAIIDLYSCHPGIQGNSTKTNHSFLHIPCNENDPTSKHKKKTWGGMLLGIFEQISVWVNHQTYFTLTCVMLTKMIKMWENMFFHPVNYGWWRRKNPAASCSMNHFPLGQNLGCAQYNFIV